LKEEKEKRIKRETLIISKKKIMIFLEGLLLLFLRLLRAVKL